MRKPRDGTSGRSATVLKVFFRFFHINWSLCSQDLKIGTACSGVIWGVGVASKNPGHNVSRYK